MPPSAYSSSEVRAMRRFVVFCVVFCAIVIFGAILPHYRVSHSRRSANVVSAAQLPANWHSDDCSDSSGKPWGQAHVCQMRRTTFTLPAGRISVDTTNGGIEVTGADRQDVALEARVQAWASSESAAENVLNAVSIDTANGDIRDHGPKSSLFSRSGYSVDYHLSVPRHLAAEFHTMNGGIDLTGIDGRIRFATTNGGVQLNQLSGDVEGHSVNGGLEVALSGDHWQGSGLHADTTNGGVQLQLPDNYSAHLETSTVNGGISVDFPITIHGELKNHLDTDLGSGGATIHTETVNGGVTISHGGSTGNSADED